MLGWVYEQHGRKKAPSNGSITQLVDLVRHPSHSLSTRERQIIRWQIFLPSLDRFTSHTYISVPRLPICAMPPSLPRAPPRC